MWRCEGRFDSAAKYFSAEVNSFGLALRHGLFGGDFSSCIIGVVEVCPIPPRRPVSHT
jgi:hypothetical protein